MEPSIFTKITQGQIPCYKVYEDSEFIAFLDINPLQTGHTLVVPKLQIDQIWELPDDIYEKLWQRVRLIAKNLQFILNTKRVIVNVEGFDVPHTHVHLIPANKGLPFCKKAETSVNKKDLEELAKKIRKEFKN